MKKILVMVLSALLAATCCVLGGCSSAAAPQKSVLDPENPVQIELWTYYAGEQLQAFDALVTQFNATVGKEKGVVATSVSQGGVGDLAKAVTASAQGAVGAKAMPDAFLAYPNTAQVINKLGKVADVRSYFTDDEQAAFIEGFLAEGDLDGDGSLKVIPCSKSTETMQINMTAWNEFAQATNTSIEALSTMEGLQGVARSYYEWTDAQTPAPNDGKPFFGRDAMANYMLVGAKQLGVDVFDVKDGAVTFNLDKAAFRQLWDSYYVPYISGYYSSEGRFRSDAVKTGDLVCYVGSSSSVVYFPKAVTVDDATSYAIEFGARTAPLFAQGKPCAVQQGAGFAVTKADEKTEAACVEFLKWFNQKEQSTEFAVSAGYVPATKEACTTQNIEAVAATMDRVPQNYLKNLTATLDTIEGSELYSTPLFEGGVAAREVMDASLQKQALAGRAQVVALLEGGASHADATAQVATDEAFNAWLDALSLELQATIK
ncbi:MAG: extracellular solute-binding protein [Raoultibacter sp.]